MTKFNFQNKVVSRIFTGIMFAICVLMCISFAELFSSLITVGGIKTNSNSDIKQQQFYLYAISLHKTDTKISAKEKAELVKKQNAGGYIWQTNEYFYVFASCYENESDATKVKTTLDNGGNTCEIIKLCFEEIEFSLNLENQEKTALTNAVCSYKNMYKKLYDLSVSIDTNLYTEVQAKVLLSDIISSFSKIKTNFETLFNPKLTSDILALKLSLTNIESILSSLSDFSSSLIPYSAQVKYAYFQILDEYGSISKTI